jgi:hypothetical protein
MPVFRAPCSSKTLVFAWNVVRTQKVNINIFTIVRTSDLKCLHYFKWFFGHCLRYILCTIWCDVPILLRKLGWLSQYSVWLQTERLRFDPWQKQGFFLWLLCPDHLWGPPSLLSSGCQRLNAARVLCWPLNPNLVPRSRMSRSYTSFPPGSWIAVVGQLYIFYIYTDTSVLPCITFFLLCRVAGGWSHI